MAKSKIHWSGPGSLQCAVSRSRGLHAARHLSQDAQSFLDLSKTSPDFCCVTCVKAARLALAKESAPQRTSRCSVPGCGSYAINPGHHGRTEGVDLDLCDVCYWRKRASAPKADTRTDSDRYAELRQLVEDCQREAMDSASPVVVFDNALRLVLDWRHR